MEHDFNFLKDNYKILFEVRDYILTIDKKVLKKNKDGKYEEVESNDAFANKLLKLVDNTDDYINYKRKIPEMDER